MSKKFDIATAKKLLADYAEKITYYMKENQMLANQVEDLKTSLKINKELLFKYITDGFRQSDHLKVINDIQAENQTLEDKNNRLIKENMIAEQKFQKLQQVFEDNTLLLREEIEKVKEEAFITKNKLLEKESILAKVVKELEHYTKGTIDRSSRKEIYITDPTRVNVDLNNELNYTRDILAKVSKMHNQEKIKSNNLDSQVRCLQEDIVTIKKTLATNRNSNPPSVDEVKSGFNTYNPSKARKDIKDLGAGIDPVDSDALSLEEFDSDCKDENADDECGINFPDKVTMKKIKVNFKDMGKPPLPNPVGHHKTNSEIPKLDFNKISSRYQGEAAVNGKQNQTANSQCRAVINPKDKEIDRLKNEVKQCNITIEDLKDKISRFKKVYRSMKNHISQLNQQIQNANAKIEGLELQLKKNVLPSTDDVSSNKNNFNDNNSMNNNTSANQEEAE